MRKLNLEHSEAVSAAKLLLIYKAADDHPARYRALLEKQITLLSEVYWFVLHSIYNPELPFDADKFEADLEKLHKDHSNGTTAR